MASEFSLIRRPLSAYKHQNDLTALAGALSISMEGMVVELTKEIKGQLAQNPSRAVDSFQHFERTFGCCARPCHAVTPPYST
ncbi:hypothetical protein PAXINDRAFT_165530, partial [Paxillus involutus ATCC 200175]